MPPNTRIPIHPPSRPGLFITATDTELGKTTVACAIAAVLRRASVKVGVLKPLATGCRADREGLVSPDAEALAHFADCRLPLAKINPVRFRPPLAPAVAAEMAGQPIDYASINQSITELADAHDLLIIEGIGGYLVPLDERCAVADLAAALDLPVVVVCPPKLGTLNHTALTCAAVRQSGARLAGLVINRFRPDDPDPAVADNPRWLAKQNRTKVLATLPDAEHPNPARAALPPAILDAIDVIDWSALARPPRRRRLPSAQP